MTHLKQWIKSGEGQYHFKQDDVELASLFIDYKSNDRKALITINGEAFTIQQTSFWKNHMAVTNASNNTIITIVPEKWYSSSFNVQWGAANYQLKIRNNPLAEWVLQQDGKDVLAYGLKTADRKVVTQITEANGDTAVILHAILWYLFWPIATENSDDNMMFLLMATA